MAGLTSPSDAATTYLGEANKNFGTGAATAGKNINFQDIGRALGGIGDIIGAFNSGGGGGDLSDSYKNAIEDLQEVIARSTADLDSRGGVQEGKLYDVFDLNQNFTGQNTADAVADYKKRFGDVSSGFTSKYTNMLNDFRPNLDDGTNKLKNTIQDSRQEFGLYNSPVMEAYTRVIDTDPRKIFPDAVDFSPEFGYNQKNPLITYMNDADAVSMMNFGRPQVNEYTRAMTDGAGPGQSLMNYGV
tara:strand:- start:6749 stop:7480 length:732 start_codon:yes stop_codon:yes gene_type:complete